MTPRVRAYHSSVLRTAPAKMAGRTVKSPNKRVPVRYHGMDYFSSLFEHRATKW